MDRAQVNTGEHYLAPLTPAPSHDALLGRLGAYWRALGVSDPKQIAALSEQALRRLPDHAESTDLLTAALLAARELLDDWLARTLDLPRQPRVLAAARAALLNGTIPNWPAVLFTPPDDAARDVADDLRVALAEAVPASVPGAMPTQRIELFSLLHPLHRGSRQDASSSSGMSHS
ncbi:MAG: hypothetical protein IAF00_12275 [Phycisphaerales bacterium]|nr:hypothetical protein [Phycisphaerales bacterium]